MRTRLRHLWDVLTTGYWFVPAVMLVIAGLVALVLLHIDRVVIGATRRVGWLYSGGSEGAKTLLSTVAGSVVTVAGVVFSITISSLTQASSQFGPRLLRNFMRDRGNQIVLGTFVATFMYCLLVLRTIHGEVGDGVAFVPQASVTGAVLLAVASTAVLIYFIHHASVMLQAPSVVAAVRADLDAVIDDLCAEQSGAGVPAHGSDGRSNRPPDDFDTAGLAVVSAMDGYVQAVDYDGLVRWAVGRDVLIRLDCRPGDYVIAGSPIGCVYPAARCGRDAERVVNQTFIVGSHGTPEQDVEYGVRQMVEVAVRALSPGVNDPFTAINCIDALASAICRIARTGLPGPLRHDDQGTLRLVTPVTTFDGLTDAAFNQIRQYGRTSVAVTARLLEVIAACAVQVTADEHRRTLLRHAEMVYVDSMNVIRSDGDRADVRRRWEAAARALGADPETASRLKRTDSSH